MTPEELIAEHLPLAHSLALQVWRKAPHALEFDELVGIANLSLVQTAQRWEPFCAEKQHDPARLEFFKPFVVRRVKGALIDATRQADWATRNLRARAKDLADAAGHDRGLTEAELAERAGMTIAQVRATVRDMAQRPVSLEAEEIELASRSDIAGGSFAATMLRTFAETVTSLPIEQQVVLALHYHKGMQLQEVARTLGLVETRISEVHAEAVLALHRVMVDAADYKEGDAVVPLTADEKRVGRAFRAAAEAELARFFKEDPPTYTVLSVLGVLRHECPARGGVSTGLELREVYLRSPADEPARIPEGRFAFVYRKGRCRFCGQTARSSSGRLIDGTGRGPIHG